MRFVDKKDGTILDTKTELYWESEQYQQDMGWYRALEYAKNLNIVGYKWRLPTINELVNIIDYRKDKPATNLLGMNYYGYWSETPCSSNEMSIWYVVFHDGIVNYSFKTSLRFVRCVSLGNK
jgi:hypothetical protein